MVWEQFPQAEKEWLDHDLEDAPPVECSQCGEIIYPGDTYYTIEGFDVCETCLRNAKKVL